MAPGACTSQVTFGMPCLHRPATCWSIISHHWIDSSHSPTVNSTVPCLHPPPPSPASLPSGHYSLDSRLILEWIEAAERGTPTSAVAGGHLPQGSGRVNSGSSSNSGCVGRCVGDEVPAVSLDEGIFKYVLMRLSDGEGRSKLLVWGDTRAGACGFRGGEGAAAAVRHYLRRGEEASCWSGGTLGQVRVASGYHRDDYPYISPSSVFQSTHVVGTVPLTLPHACRLSHGRVSLCKDTRQAAGPAGGAPGWRPHTVHQLRNRTSSAAAAAGGWGLGAAQRPVGGSGGGERWYSRGQYEWPVLDLRVLRGVWPGTA